MFNMDSWPTLLRIDRRLWRVSRRSQNACTHTPIVEEWAVESANSTADFAANPLRIGLWVWVLFPISVPILPLLSYIFQYKFPADLVWLLNRFGLFFQI